MNLPDSDSRPEFEAKPPARPGRELAFVYFLQVMLICVLVQLDLFMPMGGMLQAMVAALFVLLPVWALDRTDRPYRRYGIVRTPILGDVLWALIAMGILFPLVIGVTFLAFTVVGPQIWGMTKLPSWQFAWPTGYPMVALNHLVAVALPEEVFYRGYVMGRLDDIFKGRKSILGVPVGWSLVIQATLFGLGHVLVDLNPSRFLVFFPALAFGWLRTKRGGIGAPVLLHAGSNIFMEIFRAGFGL
jgi:membrane protease YdiL (CAAX protease family)